MEELNKYQGKNQKKSTEIPFLRDFTGK